MVELLEFGQTILIWLSSYLIIFFASYLLTMFAFPYLIGLISDAGLVRPNYQGDQIPAAAGLIFVILLPLITAIGMLLQVKSFTTINSFLYLFVTIGMAFLGLIDDQLGDHGVKGFKGHLNALLREKKLTTGGFKAIFGAIIALVFSIGTGLLTKNAWLPWTILSNFFLVVLAANTVNLFDLRPGRAGKLYVVGFVIILAFSKHFEAYLGLFIPIVAIILFYLPFDLRAKVMMGDTGSNLLGASLGMMMAWMFSDFSKVIAIIILVALQLVAEKYSFTTIIKKSHWLNYLDDLGRRKS